MATDQAPHEPGPKPAEGADPPDRHADGSGTDAGDADGTGVQALLERSRDRVAAEQARLNDLIERYHDRPLVDVGLRIYQRDREAAGTIVGSAVAMRLFLFFV